MGGGPEKTTILHKIPWDGQGSRKYNFVGVVQPARVATHDFEATLDRDFTKRSTVSPFVAV